MSINKNTHLNLIIPSHCNLNLIIVIIFKLIAMTIEIHKYISFCMSPMVFK